MHLLPTAKGSVNEMHNHKQFRLMYEISLNAMPLSAFPCHARDAPTQRVAAVALLTPRLGGLLTSSMLGIACITSIAN